MALEQCPECKNQISDAAKACPHCGKPFKSKKAKQNEMGCLIVGLFVIIAAYGCAESSRNDPLASVITENRSRVDAMNAAASVAPKPAVLPSWSYTEGDDDLSGKKYKIAWVNSLNEFELDFPYRGKQKGELNLRIHPRHGKEAFVSISRGQILCSYMNCVVGIRVDDGKVERFSAVEPSDHSSTTLFISNYQRLVKKLRGAKRAYIELEFYQNGPRTLEFNVEGLLWDEKPKTGKETGK